MPLHGMSVLAVDDNEVHCYALARALKVYGAEVLEAHTAANTLQIAKELHPDVILLDVNLPDMNGFRVCASLKADPETASIPVIFITATYQSTSAKLEAERAGGTTILFHPVEHQQLAAIIQANVERARKTQGH